MKSVLYPALAAALVLTACVDVEINEGGAEHSDAAVHSEDMHIHSGEPDASHLSAEWQIWAYSTAGPSFIGDNATIMGVDGTVLREGSNGWTCMPGNPRPMSDPENGWASAHEAMPVCADAESFKWMDAYMTNSTPVMERDAFMWMLHGDMGEDNTTPGVMTKADAADPSQWIESGPHLMLMPKDPESLSAFTTDFTSGAPYVMFADTMWAHLMIPMEDYYKYQN